MHSFFAGRSLERSPRNANDGSGEIESCPQVEVMRGRDGRDGRDGGKGDKGEVGPQGAKGDKGESGLTGMKGDLGEKGSHGSPGLPGPQGEQGPLGGGAVYTRWGRTTCPSGQGAELVYSGRAGGTPLTEQGGGANLLCLPDDPEYVVGGEKLTTNSLLRGAEYRNGGQPLSSKTYHNIPCAVCYVSTRGTVLTIPAKLTCPTHWTTEYSGYIMAGHEGHAGRTLFECIDQQPESVPELNGHDRDNALYYHVEATCNSLNCPPYNTEGEVTCAVCTR